jgi:hypothetical protein
VIILHVYDQDRAAWSGAPGGDRTQDPPTQRLARSKRHLGKRKRCHGLADFSEGPVNLGTGASKTDVDERVRSPRHDHGEELRKGLVGNAHVSLLAD